MRRFLFGTAAALALASAAVARAQTSPPTSWVFATVDAVQVYFTQMTITGILQGEASPVDKILYFSSSSSSAQADACREFALLAMAKPGQYLLRVSNNASSGYPSCKLIRSAP